MFPICAILSRAITRCQSYCELGMYEKAWTELGSLPDEHLADVRVQEWRVRTLLGLGEGLQASSNGRTLCESFPGRRDFCLLAVECLLRINQNREALELLKAGPEHLWDDALAWFYLARTQMELGDREAAKKAAERCVELVPEKRLEMLASSEFADLFWFP